MRAWRRSRYFATDVVVLAVVASVIAVFVLTESRSSSRATRRTEVTVSSEPLPGVRALPAGFLGLSLEYPALDSYSEGNPSAVSPLLEQLIRNLSPGQAPVIRIGGDSADWTWWRVPGFTRPPGVTYTLSTRWLRVARAFTAALGARLILGLNFEADSPALAGAEARALSDGLGRSAIQALELGNEPELYAVFPWYRTRDGRKVMGRPPSYGFYSFVRDFSAFASALPPIPLAGPTISGPGWMRHLDRFLLAEPEVRLVTVHRYPLQLCFVPRSSARYPTIQNLLSATASSGLADSFKRSVALAHGRGIPIRIDEFNSVSCGADRAVSDTFASALWALDALFELARVGVDGVNVHTFPGAGYDLFHFSQIGGRWRATVAPEYYGLVMFAQAAPPGSRLLRVSPAREGKVKVWATLGPDRRIRVVLINKDAARPVFATVRVPWTAPATLERLQAPGISASVEVTLGGQSFSSAADSDFAQDPPRSTSLASNNGRFVLKLSAGSAALLTVDANPE